jgi:hypothetical protein
MTNMGKKRELRTHWQRACKLILAKEDVLTVNRALELALFMDAKLDVVDHRAVLARRPWRGALMNRRPNALVIASLMVPTVVVALMANCALAAEMPKYFQLHGAPIATPSRTIGALIISKARTARTITVLSRSLPRG